MTNMYNYNNLPVFYQGELDPSTKTTAFPQTGINPWLEDNGFALQITNSSFQAQEREQFSQGTFGALPRRGTSSSTVPTSTEPGVMVKQEPHRDPMAHDRVGTIAPSPDPAAGLAILTQSQSYPPVSTVASSQQDRKSLGPTGSKKAVRRRNRKPCQLCRRKKVKCQPPKQQDAFNRCETCIRCNKKCVYSQLPVGTSFTLPSVLPPVEPRMIPEMQPNPPYRELGTLPTIPSANQQSIKADEDNSYPVDPSLFQYNWQSGV